ncbi:MAG: tRNA 2-selenouridine(34) synthase MnmH [Planctomycetota bacterium]
MDGLQTYRPTAGVIDVLWLLEHAEMPRIDVRSPGEYRRGHIPGAINIPLFDDDERAIVGTLYKQQGREIAIQRGLDLATSKMDALAESIAEVAGDQPFVIHCWRGGMRSRGVAWLCDQRGLNPTLLKGGYKSFRRSVLQSFEQRRNIILLAGKTGTGKTLLLEMLRDAGEQTIDLEGLAVHRGSVFGAIPNRPQPTTEHFENLLFVEWRKLNPLRHVWIEGENQAIGHVHLPSSVYKQMISAPIALVEADRESRIAFLLDQYAVLDDEFLTNAVKRIHKRLGGLRLQQALDAVEAGDRYQFASLTLDYYDKSYGKALRNRTEEDLFQVDLSRPADPSAVDKLIELARVVTKPTLSRFSKEYSRV